MAREPGHIAGDMKWHVYRYPQKPGGLMVLGSILARPDDLESSLNYERGIAPFPADKRLDQTQAVRRVIRAELSHNLGGRLKAVLPTVSPFVSAGGGVEAKIAHSAEATVEALGIRAEIIMPGTAKEYIDEALLAPEVLAYVRKGLYARSLYLIVGVATCKKLIMGESASRERGFSVEGDVNLPPAGIETGAGASVGRDASTGSEVEVQEECAFAYRVREFRYKKWSGSIKVADDVVQGALFKFDETIEELIVPSEASEPKEDGEVPVFECFESEDEEVGSGEGVNLIVTG